MSPEELTEQMAAINENRKISDEQSIENIKHAQTIARRFAEAFAKERAKL